MSTLIDRSFVGGELAPEVRARVDTSKYENGLAACRNFIVMRHGGVQSRSGTRLVGEVSPSKTYTIAASLNTKGIRLIPFVIDDENAYVLEFRSPITVGNYSLMRVIKNGAYVSTSILNITNITNANPAVITTSAPHGLTSGDEIFLRGIAGMDQMNLRDVYVLVLSPTTFQVKEIEGPYIDSTNFGVYSGGGSAAVIFNFFAFGLQLDAVLSPKIKFVQNANSMVFVGSKSADGTVSQYPVELKRITDTSWTCSIMTFAPTQVAPTGIVLLPSANPGFAFNLRYKISSINAITGEESLPTAVASVVSTAPTNTAPVLGSFVAAAGASEYNIYKETYDGSGRFGLLTVTSATTFREIGAEPVASKEPITSTNPFPTASDQPSSVAFFQQRLMFANSLNYPERIWGSRTGLQNNFSENRNSQDDDSIQFDMTASQINKVKSMVNIGKLVVFTSGSENSIEGDQSGVLTPTAINPKQYSQNGSTDVSPLVVGGNALYIQNQGSIVLDLAFEFQSDSYRGSDLTIFASHLFEGRTIVEWAWQKTPQSIVWCVLDDGKMIALTYIREQQIWAWHRHDTDGLVKHICSIPENGESVIYIVVERAIGYTSNGVYPRFFTERMNTRIVKDPQASDAVASDCGVQFGIPYGQLQTTSIGIRDGFLLPPLTNVAAPFNVVVVSNPTWAAGIPLALEVDGAVPPLGTYNVGDVFRVVSSVDGTVVNLTITMIDASLFRFLVVADVNIPLDMQRSLAFPNNQFDWGISKTTFTGLWHLEGEAVSVLADGAVIASPNNSQYPPMVVTNGAITLSIPAFRVQVGLPFVCDLETLNIDSPQGETAVDKAKNVGRVTVALNQSRGGFFGAQEPTGSDMLEGLYELKTRNEELYGNNPNLITDYADVNLETQWNSNGRVFIRQTEPLPISILAVAAGGFFPLRP